MKYLLFTATLLCLLPLLHPAQAQSAEEQAAQKAWMDYMTPGPMHEMLAKSDGEWEFTMTSWMAPGAEPMKSTGKTVYSMILGGRYQQSQNTASFMDMPFEGIGTLGYDNAKKVFVSSWIDNMGTGITYMEGKPDASGKIIIFTGKMLDPSTGKDYDVREVFEWVDENTHKMEMYSTMNGQESKTMELVFTRK
ncbi:DUF1579 domain-containing protein [Chitinophaga japonensis]|uniref:Uncharacterized protein DUF1579 n=1 Tax=Chitinophaga japonensis TaxID=104662 RepID=A0A562T3R7_CHIJA|nr:DUF1579 domain-containing protein [Chitinophaga japonensis]TWI88195.1 uncharacterized protein DUF1579 [Chitinophaga japonensis]